MGGRRREFSELAPGVVRVRLQGDTCTTCDRSSAAHRMAAAAASAPWTDDDNDGGTL